MGCVLATRVFHREDRMCGGIYAHKCRTYLTENVIEDKKTLRKLILNT